MPDTADVYWMKFALLQARKGVGRTSPNPPVGAVVVKENVLLGKGWHHAAGKPHAEVLAVRSAGGDSACRESTLYVTLEPCSTHGRTPPCVDLILRAGFRRVVCALPDANPAHAGRGFETLRENGVEVDVGVCREEAALLLAPFFLSITQNRPWVIAKVAMTLDGRLSLPPESGRWLSSPGSLRLAHRLRAEVDAIAIGSATLRSDDPLLIRRIYGFARGHPLPVIFKGAKELPRSAGLMQGGYLPVPMIFDNQEVRPALSALHEKGIQSLLVEGGGRLVGSFLREGLVDELVVFLTPWCGGGGVIIDHAGVSAIDSLKRLKEVRFRRVGDDVMLRARLSGTS